MSTLNGRIGSFELSFSTPPRGNNGVVHVKVAGKLIEVSWRRDQHGIWIEFPHGVFGFDLVGIENEDGRIGFRVSRRGGAEEWDGLHFTRAGEESAVSSVSGASKGTRVRAQMPGKIVRLLAQEGVVVEAGQPLLVMEAMKMENEIRSPRAGKLGKIHVREGQAVETGADLLMIEPI